MARLAFLFFLQVSIAVAAPVPMTSTSTAISLQKGFYLAPEGFALNSSDTLWSLSVITEGDKTWPQYKEPAAPGAPSAALTVRLDPFGKYKDISSYLKYWLGTYPKMGFNLLDHQEVKGAGQSYHIVDLFYPQQNRQVRQIIFDRRTSALILTCNGPAAQFPSTYQKCSRIINTLSWRK